MMCGIDEAINWISELPESEKQMCVLNRMKYIRNKDVGVKPKFHKGQYGKKYDSWTCGNCGCTIRGNVGDNYCQNCGYRILWDSTRCLTGIRDEEE